MDSVAVNSETMEQVYKLLDVDKRAVAAWHFLLSRLKADGYCNATIGEIAEALAVDVRKADKAVTLLAAGGFIVRNDGGFAIPHDHAHLAQRQ